MLGWCLLFVDLGRAAPPSSDGTEVATRLPAYDGRFAADPLLTPEEVALVPAAQLPLLRNEIFARHGRAFERAELVAWFAGQPWYRPDPGYDDTRLTANDKANAALIQSFETAEDIARKRAVDQGEYRGTEQSVVFVDAKTAEVLEQGDDVYGWERTPTQWAPRGDWVVTWTGGGGLEEAESAWLWQLDHTRGTVVRRTKLPRRQG